MASTLTDVARQLNLTGADTGFGHHPRPLSPNGPLPALIMMTDARRTHDPVADVLRLPRGAAVILRHYELVPQARFALARILRAATTARHVKLLIADDMRLALDLRADGVHFSENALSRAGTRLHRKPQWIVTAAAHSATALWRAAHAGADAALLSPVFPTLSHPGAASLGVLRFAAIAHGSALPVYVLGGIGAANARRLRGSAAAGIAAIGGLTAARRRDNHAGRDENGFLSLG